jgi:hypothetical protein
MAEQYHVIVVGSGAVFVDNRYVSKDQWFDGEGRPYRRGEPGADRDCERTAGR